MEGENGLAKLVAEELERTDHNIIYKGCLCEYVNFLERMRKNDELPELFLLHPHDSDEDGCYSNISKFINGNSDSYFYILAYDDYDRSEPRISGIGEFPNLTYITEENVKDIINKLLDL